MVKNTGLRVVPDSVTLLGPSPTAVLGSSSVSPCQFSHLPNGDKIIAVSISQVAVRRK